MNVRCLIIESEERRKRMLGMERKLKITLFSPSLHQQSYPEGGLAFPF